MKGGVKNENNPVFLTNTYGKFFDLWYKERQKDASIFTRFKRNFTTETLEDKFKKSDEYERYQEYKPLKEESENIKKEEERKQQEKQKNIQNIQKEIETEENDLKQFEEEKELILNKEIEDAFEDNFMSLLESESISNNIFKSRSNNRPDELIEFINYYKNYGYSRFRPTGLTIKKICLNINKKYKNICTNIHEYMINTYTTINKPKFEEKYNAEIKRRKENIITKIKNLQEISIPATNPDQSVYTDTSPEQDTNQDTIPEQDAVMDPQVSQLLKTLREPTGGKKRRRKTRKTK